MKGKLTLTLLIVFVAGGVAYASRRDAVVAVKPSPLFAQSLTKAIAQFDGRISKSRLISASLRKAVVGQSTSGTEATCAGYATCGSEATCLNSPTCVLCGPTVSEATCFFFPTCGVCIGPTVADPWCFGATSSGLFCPTGDPYTCPPAQTSGGVNCTFQAPCGGGLTYGNTQCNVSTCDGFVTCSVSTCAVTCIAGRSTCNPPLCDGSGQTAYNVTCASQPTCSGWITCNGPFDPNCQ